MSRRIVQPPLDQWVTTGVENTVFAAVEAKLRIATKRFTKMRNAESWKKMNRRTLLSAQQSEWSNLSKKHGPMIRI